MRWAIPASAGLHFGLIAAAWLALQLQPDEPPLSEAALSIDIITLDEEVTEPSETASSESVNLVSAGLTEPAAEPEEVEPIEPPPSPPPVAAPPEPVPVPAEPPEPAEAEETASAEVLTALAATDEPVAAPVPTADDAPTIAETVAPSDAPILERLDEAAKLADLEPAESPPIPAPRLVRKPVETAEKPVEQKPDEKKKAAQKPVEKPVEKKEAKRVANLGNGGEAQADAAAAKASGGAKGNVPSAGTGTISAWEGKIRSKYMKALRKPKDAKRGAEVRVLFRIDANGRVVSSKLSRSSGDSKLDQAAMAAIERAAPYPPIPEGAGKSTWDITIPIGIN